MDYAFIVNPAAGTGFAVKAMEGIEAKLQERQITYRILYTERPGHATELAAALAADGEVAAVVAVGGDGTAGEVAAGLCGTGKPMGILPAGTGNDFIKTAGIPNDPDKALETLLNEKPRETDTGTVNGGFFLNVCGTGFDVTVLDYAEKEKLKHRGLTPYLLGLVKAVFHYRGVHLKVTDDEETREGLYLVCSIANGRYIGGGIPICPAADASDGKLDLVLIRDVPRRRIPLYLPGLMLSRDLDFRITSHKRTSRVTIEGEGLRVNIDGEIRSMDRAEFEIRPASLRIIRPALKGDMKSARHE